MKEFTEENLADAVIDRMSPQTDPRLHEVMTSLIRHLHSFVREVELNEQEWMQAIEFLTDTGQLCDDSRQEFILLSDTLGVSMLVDAINHRRLRGATENTVLGPFHINGAPVCELGTDISRNIEGGLPAFVSGRVLNEHGAPIAGALLDVWQVRPDRLYDVQDPESPEMQLRAKFRTDADGRYYFHTIVPVSYPIPDDGSVGRMLTALGREPWRPAHMHFIVSANDYSPVTTHLFVRGDPYLESDAVFGVKKSLIVDFKKTTAAEAPDGSSMETDFYSAEFDFVLVEAS